MSLFYKIFNVLCYCTGITTVLSFSTYHAYSYWVNSKLKSRRRNIVKKGERVVIIGASSGIGKELALQYSARGAHVLLVARRENLLSELQQHCQELGGQIYIQPCDITLLDGLHKIRDAAAQLGHIDTLILNAGALSSQTFKDLLSDSQDIVEKLSVVEKIMKVNFTSFVHITGFLLQLLDCSENCNVIVVSSAAGVVGAPTRSLYAASKHALHGFFNSLRMEWKGTNRHICLVCPGSVSTELRLSALDRTNERVSGSVKGNLDPSFVASQIISASDNSKTLLFLPSKYRFTILLEYFFPDLITYLARKKYGLK